MQIAEIRVSDDGDIVGLEFLKIPEDESSLAYIVAQVGLNAMHDFLAQIKAEEINARH